MKFTICAVLALLSLGTVSVSRAQDADASKTRLLPQLVQMANDEGKKIYNITEILDGESETAVIRPEIRCHNTYSVAKLFTCATLEILQDQGKLDVDEKLFPILEKYFPENFDPRWRDVTIADVIRHRAGFDSSSDKLDIDAVDPVDWDRDFLKIVLSQKLPNEPGAKFCYTDAAFYLASRVVSEKTGEKLDDFMVRELLEPLRFSEYAFSTDPEGYPIGATGMYISTSDMAKLGQMYVQDGVYDGKRILSKEVVDEAFARGFELNQVDKDGNSFVKGGMNGQLLYMNRKTKRVVALHSFGSDTDAFIKFLVENDK